VARERVTTAQEETRHLDDTVFVLDIEAGPVFRFAAAAGGLTRAVPDGARWFVGRTVGDLVPDGVGLQHHLSLAALGDGPQVIDVDWPLPTSIPRVRLTVVPLEGGRRLGGVARQLRSREHLGYAALDSLPVPTAVLDRDGVVRLINARWLTDAVDLSGALALPGDSFVDTLPDLDLRARIRRVLDGRQPSLETDQVEGERRYHLQVNGFPFDGEHGAIVTRNDVSEFVRERRAVPRRWEAAFASAPIGMAVIDADGRILQANPTLCTLLGRSEPELLRVKGLELTHPEDREAFTAALPAGDGAAGHDVRCVRPDGSVRWTRITWARLDGDGDPHYFLQVQDRSGQRQAEDRLISHRRLLELVAASTPLADVLAEVVAAGERHLPGTIWTIATVGLDLRERNVTLVGADGEDADAMREAYRTFAPTRWHERVSVIALPEVDGPPIATAFGMQGAWALPIVHETFVAGFLLVRRPPPEPEHMAFVEQLGSVIVLALQRDATNRRLADRLLEDPLTGLPTRVLFNRRVEDALGRIGNRSRGLAVLFADVDHLARVNEDLGHLAGDELLVQTALRLGTARPVPDAIARSGGDEFLVLLEDVADADAALAAAEALRDHLAGPVPIDDLEVACPVSIGVAYTADPTVTFRELQRDATLAVAAAKAQGRDRVELYSDDLRHAMPTLALERSLRIAVAAGQFVVHFQPEIDLVANQVLGVEALVRWDHPTLGLLLPAEFLAVAEEAGLTVEIGRQVLKEACAWLVEWSSITGAPQTVSINLTARQLVDPGLVAFVAATLEGYGVRPEQLVFEMTESTFIDEEARAGQVVSALRDLGVGVAVDDFGTGYASLRYLRQIPADVLKIDRSFVHGVGTDANDAALVAAVVHLAHQLDVAVTAEGVETAEQVAHLRRLGCDRAQGYLWAAPVPGDQIPALCGHALPAVPPVEIVEPPTGERSEVVDELLAVLTHELSTPLTIIGGYAELLAERVDDGSRSDVAAIERNVHTLARVVSALGDARGLRPVAEAHDFDAVAFVADALAEMRPLFTSHRLALRLPADEVRVHIDPASLRQILTNLVGNALKFAPPGTAVEVSVAAPAGNDGPRISVVDHGPGVDAERVDELFGRFARLGSTRPGLGLGLYLAQELAGRDGAAITYQPAPGGGATFVVSVQPAIDAP
jgi:diguanylate cyclase (GGDEF)-like protein/PAS domain S-box-containing protein